MRSLDDEKAAALAEEPAVLGSAAEEGRPLSFDESSDLSSLFAEEEAALPAVAPRLAEEAPLSGSGPVEVDADDIIEIGSSVETPEPAEPAAPVSLPAPRMATPVGAVSGSRSHWPVATQREPGKPASALIAKPTEERAPSDRLFDADALDGFDLGLPSEPAAGSAMPAPAPAEPTSPAPVLSGQRRPAPSVSQAERRSPVEEHRPLFAPRTAPPPSGAQSYVDALARVAAGLPLESGMPAVAVEKLGQTVVKVLLARGAISQEELIGLLAIPADKLSTALVRILLERSLVRSEDLVTMLMLPADRVTATALKILVERGSVTPEDLAKALG
ncbi:MAG: hypothetical protein HY901_18570 [Deltaproteobacteria bacterium]|nr:hypothetical protein [Deltaproteobacteria bacterium]